MKTFYTANLNAKIKTASKALAEALDDVAAVKKEMRIWQKGRPQHDALQAQKAGLDRRIAYFKKQIAETQRLLKNPEVVRRNRICHDIEAIAEVDMDLDKADSVRCYVNDAVGGGKVEAKTENSTNWGYYAKSCKYPKIEHDVRITVDPDWDKQVYNKDLEFLGGMLTLSAKPLHKGRQRKAVGLAEKHGVDLFEAVWMRKSRGFQVVTESGFIAVKRTSLGVIPATAYHSESPMAAVEGCYRKLKHIDEFGELPLELRDVPIDAVATWADADAVGACHPGVKAWCDAVDISYRTGKVPLIDVVRGYYRKPAPEAKAIILHVLRAYPRRAKAA